MVGARLALPWPLQAALEPWATAGAPGLSPSLAFGYGLAFLAVVATLGMADHFERLWFSRFAIGTVRDLRATAFERAVPRRGHSHSKGLGDVVARLIGDTARAKVGIKGFLVHVATNGTMYAGVVVVLFWVNPRLGAVFGIAGVALAAVTAWGGARAYEAALRFRTKEGKLAESIHRALRDDPASVSVARVNRSSGSHEATLTRVTGRATWAAHAIFGAAVLASLVLGAMDVAAGRMEASAMIAFALYALMLRAPVVQLVRQGTRSGKILACLVRLADLVDLPSDAPPTASSTVDVSVGMTGVRCKTTKGSGRRRSLDIPALALSPGEWLAIHGAAGSGKSTFLRVLTGLERPRSGSAVIGGHEAGEVGSALMGSGVVGYLPATPEWRRTPIRDLLGIPAEGPPEEVVRVLDATGAGRVLERFPDGLGARVGSNDLSEGERRQIWLARVLLARPQLLVLDDPFLGWGARRAAAALRAMREAVPAASLVVASSRPLPTDLFDHVFRLRKGRLRVPTRRSSAAPGGDGAGHAPPPPPPALGGTPAASAAPTPPTP